MEKRRGILKFIPFLLHRTTLIVIVFAAALVVVLGGKFEIANAARPYAELEIQKLTACYALGIDDIGRGNLQQGKNILRDCFTQDAKVIADYPGLSVEQGGTDAWADYAYSVFQGNGDQATQHLIGSIYVSVLNANQATMSSYVHATEKRSGTSIDITDATYKYEVVKEGGRWKISHLILTFIARYQVEGIDLGQAHLNNS